MVTCLHICSPAFLYAHSPSYTLTCIPIHSSTFLYACPPSHMLTCLLYAHPPSYTLSCLSTCSAAFLYVHLPSYIPISSFALGGRLNTNDSFTSVVKIREQGGSICTFTHQSGGRIFMKEDSFHPVLPKVLGFRCNVSKTGTFASLAVVGVEALEMGW